MEVKAWSTKSIADRSSLQTMNVGDGVLVGMSILPKGVAPEMEEAEEAEIAVEDETDDTADTSSGPWLLCLTKKVHRAYTMPFKHVSCVQIRNSYMQYTFCLLQGLAKKVPVSAFRLSKGRIGKGIGAARLNSGDSLAAAEVVGATRDGKECDQDILISTVNGMLLRLQASQIGQASRYAKGYRAVKLKENDEVSSFTVINNQND